MPFLCGIYRFFALYQINHMYVKIITDMVEITSAMLDKFVNFQDMDEQIGKSRGSFSRIRPLSRFPPMHRK